MRALVIATATSLACIAPALTRVQSTYRCWQVANQDWTPARVPAQWQVSIREAIDTSQFEAALVADPSEKSIAS